MKCKEVDKNLNFHIKSAMTKFSNIDLNKN